MSHAVIDRKPGSITFRVDDDEPAKDLLPEVKLHEGQSANRLSTTHSHDSLAKPRRQNLRKTV